MVKRKDNKGLRVITVYLPIPYLAIIEHLKDLNIVPSRSEYIRMAIWGQLSQDMELMRRTLDSEIIIPKFEDIIEIDNDFEIEEKTDPKTDETRFKIITIYVSSEFLNIIEEIKKVGLIPSRSEYIRMAIWEKLSRDYALMQKTIDAEIKLPERVEIYEYANHFRIEDKIYNKITKGVIYHNA